VCQRRCGGRRKLTGPCTCANALRFTTRRPRNARCNEAQGDQGCCKALYALARAFLRRTGFYGSDADKVQSRRWRADHGDALRLLPTHTFLGHAAALCRGAFPPALNSLLGLSHVVSHAGPESRCMRQLALAGKQPLSMASGDTGAVLLRLIYEPAGKRAGWYRCQCLLGHRCRSMNCSAEPGCGTASVEHSISKCSGAGMHKNAWVEGMSLPVLTRLSVLVVDAEPAARRCLHAAPCSDVRS
jgi:hypothetical protein